MAPLTFTKRDVGSGIAVAAITTTAPFLLQAIADLGVFAGGGEQPRLLKYYANADRAEHPNDWYSIQKLSTATLDVTLRDPYMAHPGQNGEIDVAAGHTQSEFQCPTGDAWYEGEANP